MVYTYVAAQEFGLANVTAIQEGTAPADFQHGANFAIISATANNGSFFAGKGMNITPFSLDTQMFWFRTHMQELVQHSKLVVLLFTTLQSIKPSHVTRVALPI